MSAALDTAAALTATEATRFDDLEQTIERGLAGFVEVGQALEAIRDGKLYRETHGTFEEYLRERWGMSRSYGYRQIEAAQVAEVVSPNGDIPAPTTEAVARELAPLKGKPEQARQAWRETVEEHGPTPTASEARKVVEGKVKPRPKPKPAKPGRPSKREVEALAYKVLERAQTLRRSVAKLAEASEERPDVDIPYWYDLLRAHRALGDLLARLAPVTGDDGEGSQPADGDLPDGWTLEEIESLAASETDQLAANAGESARSDA